MAIYTLLNHGQYLTIYTLQNHGQYFHHLHVTEPWSVLSPSTHYRTMFSTFTIYTLLNHGQHFHHLHTTEPWSVLAICQPITQMGLARTTKIHCIWPYIGLFPGKNVVCAPYIYVVLANPTNIPSTKQNYISIHPEGAD